MPASNARSSAAKKTAARELLITRILDAPRELVFKAWTEPKRVMRWMGSKGVVMTSCDIELRAGGSFRWNMRTPDGKPHVARGVYREIVKPERLVFTWAWEGGDGRLGHETLVTISLAEHGAKTKLTLHHAVFETAEACAAHAQGWTGSLDRMAEYVAKA